MGFFKSLRKAVGRSISGVGQARRAVGKGLAATGIPVVSQLGTAAAATGKFETSVGRVIEGKEKFSSKLIGEGITAGVEGFKAVGETAALL